MDDERALDIFISRLARKIAIIYPSNYADKEDYIQEGHLKLAEIRRDEYIKRDLRAYAIVAIARAMRCAALEAMCAASAPCRIKKQVHEIVILLADGKTEHEICQELKITRRILIGLRSLINPESLNRLFEEPMIDSEPFLMLDDLLSSNGLTREDKVFIWSQFNNVVGDLDMTRKQQWLKRKSLRPKLIRNGYGI